jgi:hypothetical protein
MLAPFMVTNTGDGIVNSPGDQPGTIRQAIFDAQISLEADDRIEFASNINNATIMLTQGELTITQSVTIDASMLEDGITIKAFDPSPEVGNGTRIFNIPGFGSNLVTLKRLTLTGGDADAEAGGIVYRGGEESDVWIHDCKIIGNTGRLSGGDSRATGALAA